MFQSDAPSKSPLFTYHPPLTERACGLVSIPHSGEDVPAEFWPMLSADLATMREDVDFRVDALVDIEALQQAGVGVLVAHVHRVCVDLNRDEKNCILFWMQNTQGVPQVKERPTAEYEQELVDRYHRPFFEVYTSLLRELERRLPGPVPVVDLHSMPSRPTAYHMKQNPHQRLTRAEFCISDQHGKTCAPAFIARFGELLRSQGFSVAVNDPYVGGFVTTFVNRFRTNNIQIEINRAVYMDEEKKELIAAHVQRLRPALTEVLIAGLTGRAV